MSLIRYALCCSLFFLAAGGVSHGDIVAHWPLNEVDTDVFADLVAGNDGFLPEGSVVEFADDGPPGLFDTSVRFIGDQGASFIETPFEGIGGANPRTITAWVKAEPQTRATAVVAYGSLANGRKWHFRIENTRIRTEFQGGQNFGGDTDAANGEWHHIASVFPEGGVEGDDILHYVDGVLEPKLGGTSLPIDTGIGEADDAFPVNIGFAVGHAGRWFQGQIADVRIYDEGLDQQSIQDVMDGGGFLPPGLKGDFNSDDVVDLADFMIMAENFNSKFSFDESYSKGDLSLNTRVDLKDFIGFRELFNGQQAAVASVPEPNVAWYVFTIGLIWLRRSQNRAT